MLVPWRCCLGLLSLGRLEKLRLSSDVLLFSHFSLWLLRTARHALEVISILKISFNFIHISRLFFIRSKSKYRIIHAIILSPLLGTLSLPEYQRLRADVWSSLSSVQKSHPKGPMAVLPLPLPSIYNQKNSQLSDVQSLPFYKL